MWNTCTGPQPHTKPHGRKTSCLCRETKLCRREGFLDNDDSGRGRLWGKVAQRRDVDKNVVPLQRRAKRHASKNRLRGRVMVPMPSLPCSTGPRLVMLVSSPTRGDASPGKGEFQAALHVTSNMVPLGAAALCKVCSIACMFCVHHLPTSCPREGAPTRRTHEGRSFLHVHNRVEWRVFGLSPSVMAWWFGFVWCAQCQAPPRMSHASPLFTPCVC